MENRTGPLLRPDGAGISGGYRADKDRPEQSVPLFICFIDSGRPVQSDRHGADESTPVYLWLRGETWQGNASRGYIDSHRGAC